MGKRETKKEFSFFNNIFLNMSKNIIFKTFLFYLSENAKVAQLFDGKQNPGLYSISYNTEQLANGMYYIQLSTNKYKTSTKLVVQH